MSRPSRRVRRVGAAEVAAFCWSAGLEYRARLVNPPLSGVLFRSRATVRLRDVIDASTADPSFILGRVKARGRGRREVAVLVLPLRRSVPNLILAGVVRSVLPGLGVALNEEQRLPLEGDFDTRFRLYCPSEYERDALYVLTPDLMALLIDAAGIRAGVSDVEFVDDRVLCYAPVEKFYSTDGLGQVGRLATLLHEKLDRQTKRYDDSERAGSAGLDPFRLAQLTTLGSEGYVVGDRGRRVRTRTTLWQKIGIGIAGLAVGAALVYWLWMVAHAMTAGG